MIKSIRSKKLKLLLGGNTSKVPASDLPNIMLILNALATATCINDVDLPGRRLHCFKEKKPVVWSLDVSGNYRITFTFDGTDFNDVDYLDTH